MPAARPSDPHRRRASAALLGLALLAACAPDEPVGVRRAITDGVPDPDHPAVGLLLVPTAADKLGTCTGTLVGSRTVLTAAHCLTFVGEYRLLLAGSELPIERLVPHPSFDPAIPKLPPPDDIGLLLLATPAAIAPLDIGPTMPRPGTPLTLVGFGKTGDGQDDDRVKRRAVNLVETVLPTRFSIVGSGAELGNLCQGDSGGPALTDGAPELVVGVTSASEGACGHSRSWLTRVDAYRAWLRFASRGDIALPERAPPSWALLSPAAVVRAPPSLPGTDEALNGGCTVVDGPPVRGPAGWLALGLALLRRRRRLCRLGRCAMMSFR